jgi:hypothetical protein
MFAQLFQLQARQENDLICQLNERGCRHRSLSSSRGVSLPTEGDGDRRIRSTSCSNETINERHSSHNIRENGRLSYSGYAMRRRSSLDQRRARVV